MTYDGLVYDLDEELYHSRPELSSTQARVLLDSPARYKYSLTAPKEHNASFDLGHAVHTEVLGTGSNIEVLEFDNYRTKAAQEARDEAYGYGRVPMLRKDMQPVWDMKEAVLAHKTARLIFEQDGHAEVSVFSTDPDTGVRVRARFDWYARIAADLKTTSGKASPASFNKSVTDYGYHIQEQWYTDALMFAGERIEDFAFIVVEVSRPHHVGVHYLNDEYREIAREDIEKARRIHAECTASGVWPGYPDTRLAPPGWMVWERLKQTEGAAS